MDPHASASEGNIDTAETRASTRYARYGDTVVMLCSLYTVTDTNPYMYYDGIRAVVSTKVLV